MGNFHSKQSKKENYYEKLLTTLQNDIKTRQLSIQRLRTFNRSCQVHLVLFSSIFYGGYTVFLFFQYKLKLSVSVMNKSSLAFLVLFPVGIFYIKKLLASLVNFFIRRKQDALKAKQTELKDRIEELKVETRYYQTKDLIEKYDKSASETKSVESELTRRKVGNGSTGNLNNNSNNTVSTVSTVSVNRGGPNNNSNGSVNSVPRMSPLPPQIHPPQFRPPPFRSPTWMDRFMDALIGDDSRNQKYALICSQCFNHNGLATPELFDTVRYRCPNCGFFNQHQKKKDESERIKEITNNTDTDALTSSDKQKKRKDKF